MNKKMKRNIIIASAAVLLIAAIIITILLLPPKSEEESYDFKFDGGIDMTASVSDNGMHNVTINTNSKGEIENNSYGTLINYVPAQIDKISMKTLEGSYTFLLETPVDSKGNTQATVYTLEGFESFDLAATNPGLLASSVCSLDFSMVADLEGDEAADFGFENPRAEATVYYNDGTFSKLVLGDDAPGGNECYVQFGDSKTVYIVAKNDVAPMLLSITDLFDTALNSDKTSIADDSFDEIILGGTHLSEEISFVANTEGTIYCYYLMSSHGNVAVNTTEASAIVGAIKALTADEVVCVNPDSAQLEKYGLKNPYATVKTNYLSNEEYDEQGNKITTPEVLLSVSLLASKEDAEGMVYMMEEGGKLIYRISADSVPWATTTAQKLASEYVLSPNYVAIETMKVETKGRTYDFLLFTEEVPYTDENGNTTSYLEPRAYFEGEYLDPDQFYIFFQDMALMEVAGEDSGTANTSEFMKVTYTYVTDRPADTVVFCLTDTQKVIPLVNSQKTGYVYRNYVQALAENLESLVEGKEIAAVNTSDN